MTTLIFTVGYIVIIILTILHLITTGSRPSKTLSWMIAIISIPVMGLIGYYAVGINRRKLKFFEKAKRKKVEQYYHKLMEYHRAQDAIKTQMITVEDTLMLSKLISKTSLFRPTQGNAIRVLYDGKETFDEIFAAMREAKKFIHVQYYIFEEGVLANQFLEIFAEKISEGVQVRFIYDGFGSIGLSKGFRTKLSEAGVKSCSFLPIGFKRIDSTLNYRNHRKIVVVDGKVGFTGGINVSDKYINGDPHLGRWHDLHVRLEGPVVASLNAVFIMDWFYGGQENELLDKIYLPPPREVGASVAQIVQSGPDTKFASVQQQYFHLINRADRYIYIANSYVIPGEAILMALKTAALSGIDVQLLLPEKSDSNLVKWTIRSYLPELIEAGVRIHLFQDGFLHSKLIIVDDEIASVGTANLDVRSFEQNFEVNALIYDEQITKELKAHFLSDCRKSRLYTESDVRARNRRTMILEGVARVFSPLL